MTSEERARVVAWLRQDVCGERVPQELRSAAADELDSITIRSSGKASEARRSER
jgi:hypothetical protein